MLPFLCHQSHRAQGQGTLCVLPSATGMAPILWSISQDCVLKVKAGGSGLYCPSMSWAGGTRVVIVDKCTQWVGAGVNFLLLFHNFRRVSIPEVAQSW